mmetsp:Transcript_9677/g.22257  ORF Transcript_9677/g.22257 Transcript_9677/m.22257 type:complete len:324 (+) Transcript_9677:808-1779(+)
MPKRWGKSQKRLKMNLKVKFTNEITDEYHINPKKINTINNNNNKFQKFIKMDRFMKKKENGVSEDADFMGAGGISRKLEVLECRLIDEDGTPSSETIDMKHGVWRICPGRLPTDSNTLRFYVEVPEKVAQDDLYLPKGRIYGTCGYYPNELLQFLRKSPLSNQQESIIRGLYDKNTMAQRQIMQAMNLGGRVGGAGIDVFSWIRIMILMSILQYRGNKLHQSLVNELARNPPEDSLERSKHTDVSLSKEGGICTRVKKPFSVEYHILGRCAMTSLDVKPPPPPKKDEEPFGSNTSFIMDRLRNARVRPTWEKNSSKQYNGKQP